MIGRTRIARRLEATLAVTALLLVLALSWELRPALPQLPQSFSAPLPSGTIAATLKLAAWIVFVLLDLALIRKVLQFATRKEPTATELRLRNAFVHHAPSFDGTRDWRAYAAPLAPPVLRLPARREPTERDSTSARRQQHGPRELSAPVGDHQVDGTTTAHDALRQVYDDPLGAAANQIGKEERDGPLAGLERIAQVALPQSTESAPGSEASQRPRMPNRRMASRSVVGEAWLPARVIW